MKTKIILSCLLAGVVIGGIVYVVLHSNSQARFTDALVWIKTQGWRAPALFVLLFLSTAGIVMPVAFLVVAAGILFGVFQGTLIILFCTLLSATILFLIARKAGCGNISKTIEANPKFKAIDAAIAKSGWKIVAMLRLVPILNSNLINYACGLTRIHLKNYLMGTLLGSFPAAVLYTYIGFLIGDIAKMHAQNSGRSAMEWALVIVSL
ncbi:MAG: hypothetical protein COW13_00115, partial [Candidatus Omnitrophica bacterium CG12_big_fil_rev_8_21_14_0_65_50_5]